MKSFIEIAIVVACIHVADCRGFASTSSQPSEDMQFKTGYLATPITLPDGTMDWLISAIDLNIDALTEDEGMATVVLDESKVKFDEFGDATVIEKGRVQEWNVILRRMQTPDFPNDSRRLFAIEFAEDRWSNRFQFVWSPQSIDSCLLMVFDPMKRNFLRVTNDVARSPANDARVKDENTVNLLTDHYLLEPSPLPQRGFGHTQLNGSLNGTVTVEHDANSVQFSPFGEVTMTTLMGYPSQTLKFTKIPAIDRSGRDRHIYQSSPTREGHELSLVIDPAMIETQRLIIKKNGDVQHVLTVYDPSERNFRRDLERLDYVSAPERDAIIELRRLLRTRVQFHIKNKFVSNLTLMGESVSKAALDQLPNLSQLNSLSLDHCIKLSPSDLEGLKSHPTIEHLSLRGTPISDDGLKAISTLGNLKSLLFSYEPERGPNGESPNYGVPSEKCTITNDGFKMLRGLTSLESLYLNGLAFGDDDLPTLDEIPALKTVDFHFVKLTAARLIDWSKNARATKLSASVPAIIADRESVSIRIDVADHLVSLEGDFDDETLARLEGRQDIRTVGLDRATFVTSEGLKKVLAMDWLESLSMSHCQMVTDDALFDISKMSELETLSLWYCRNVTSEGSRHLYKLKKLKSLNLGGSGVTEAGYHAAQGNLPQCKIQWHSQ